MKRIIVGVDLSLTSKSLASIYSPLDDKYYGKTISFENSYQGYEYVLSECEKIKEEIQLEFVMEPTGLIWMPLSCYLIKKGHIVYRVTTQKSSDFRKFISRHSKSDKIDSKAMAKIPVIASDKIYKIYLPKTDLGILGRKTKYMAKLVHEITSHKQRIQSVFDMINPGVLKVFGNNSKFTQISRTLLRYFSNPLKIIESGKEGFIKSFKKLSKKAMDDSKLESIYYISTDTINIYKPMLEEGSLPFDFDEEASMIQNELDIIEFLETGVKKLEKEIQILYKKVDNNDDLRSIQGIGVKIAPAILGIIGDVTRFNNIGSFKKYCGYVSRKSQSSEKDKKGLKIDKAAQSLLKASLYMAAETARKWDVEFANFYYRLIKKGLHHISAISALANKMSGRVYAVLKRMQLSNTSNYAGYCNSNDSKSSIKSDKLKYEMKDLNGQLISKKKARAIVLEKYPGKNKKASPGSQNNLSKQLTPIKNENSSERNCRTRQAKYILNDIFNKYFFQDDNCDTEKKYFIESLKNLKKVIEGGDVDKLLISRVEKNEKK